MSAERLAVISTHPIQYHAPVYREVERLGVPVTAIYGSDFSVAGYHDREFGIAFSWSTDLLSGYSSVFLSQVANGGASSAETTSARDLFKALNQVAPSATLISGYWPSFYKHSILQLLVQRRPVMFRAETSDHARTRSKLLKVTRDCALKLFYQRCSALLYIGEQSRRHFDRLGVSGREVYFSPYCVDSSGFQSNEEARLRMRVPTRSELQLSDDQFVVVFSGKLVARKGPDVLVEAIGALSADLRERVTIVFVGSGEMRGSLAAHAGTINMRFVGFRNQDQLSRYYHAADVLVLPSRAGETWGLVVNEALLHGIPCVVSTEVGCAPDLIVPGESGEVFANGSAHSLRDALMRVFAWHHTGLESRERCRRQVATYSVAGAAKGIVAAFDATLAKRAPSRIADS